MLLLALTISSLIVSFGLLVLFDQLFSVPWTIAAPRALIATVLGHWLGLLWLYFLHKGKD